MEENNNLSHCGLELLSEQALRTQASNYDFKYVPGDQFQRIIRTVQRDRMKQNKYRIWTEFCNTELQATMLQTSEIATSTALSPGGIFQTKSSSIRIISSPTLRNNANTAKIVTTQKESSWIYKPPQIRIMTDEEISEAVDNAFKEVLNDAEKSKSQQSIAYRGDDGGGDRNSVSSSDNEKDSRKDEAISESDSEDNTERSSVSLNRTEDCGKALSTNRDDQNQQQHERISNTSSESSKLESPLCSPVKSTKLTEKGENADVRTVMVSTGLEVADQLSIKSGCEDEEEFIENTSDNTCEISALLPASVADAPLLTSREKEELREFLGIEEYILKSEINVSQFDDERNNSSVEEVDNNEKEADINPVIHIKQPTPGRLLREVEHCSTLKPIQSSPTLHRTPSAETGLTNKVTPNLAPFANKSQKISPRPVRNRAVPTTPKSIATSARSSKATKPTTSPAKQAINLSEQKQEFAILMLKTATYQQRILLSLEQIRIQLDDIPQPDDIMDLKRRQKRADEFCIRLSRNYLYEIDRLMEEIQMVPKSEYLSRKDNYVPTKVCSLFNTLSQAVNTYLKHMNGFITGQVPKMLDKVLAAASKSIKMCVHKTIFNRRDSTVQDLLRGIKELENHLRENQPTTDIQEYRSEKSLRLKAKKSDVSNAGFNRKLSMYDSMPVNKFGVKRKPSVFKPPIKSRTNINNFVKTVKHGNKKQSTVADALSIKAPNSPIEAPKCLENSRGGHRKIKEDPPKIMEIETHIQNIGNDETMVDEDLDKGSKCPANTCRNNNNENESAVQETVTKALESITKQQVQEMLGPLISSLGLAIPNKSDCTDVEITNIVNHLMASQMDIVRVETTNKGPSVGLNQPERTGNKFKDALQNTTLCPRDNNNLQQTYDNNANCKRELAMQNLYETHKPHQPPPLTTTTTAIVVPAPNAFSAGELNSNNNNQDGSYHGFSMTPSQQHQLWPPYKLIEDSEALVAGSRTRINTMTTARNNASTEDKLPGGRCEGGGDDGANETDIQNEKEVTKDVPSAIRTDYNRINEERLRFLEKMADNPLYANECFSQPWKVVTKITNRIVDEVTHDVERSINFGEETFVRDFIQMELE